MSNGFTFHRSPVTAFDFPDIKAALSTVGFQWTEDFDNDPYLEVRISSKSSTALIYPGDNVCIGTEGIQINMKGVTTILWKAGYPSEFFYI